MHLTACLLYTSGVYSNVSNTSSSCEVTKTILVSDEMEHIDCAVSNPVSYTHLDVYKRQDITGAVYTPITSIIVANIIVFLIIFLNFILNISYLKRCV